MYFYGSSLCHTTCDLVLVILQEPEPLVPHIVVSLWDEVHKYDSLYVSYPAHPVFLSFQLLYHLG
jgi:hypothetical protein